MSGVAHLIVAIPARNEEALLPGCLRSVDTARRRLRRLRPDIRVVVAVALDGCTDGTAGVVAAWGATAVELSGNGVGLARDAAIQHGLDRLDQPRDASTWIACTDADTAVPDGWLERQVALASNGVDLIVGTVEPVGLEDGASLAAWHAGHDLDEGHTHVHGANLGVRADRWRRAGGFGPLQENEDIRFVTNVKRHTNRWLATDAIRVRTSGRLYSRIDHGFAGYIRSLCTEPR